MSFVKRLVKDHCPDVILNPVLKLRSWLRHPTLRLGTPEAVFTDIKRHNRWANPESVSGEGSTLSYTEPIRQRLTELLVSLDVKSILDAPCGDFNWMRQVELGERMYYGCDIVKELVAANQAQYGNARRTFRPADLIRDPLPAADLVLCRDCFIHLPHADILRALRNFQRTGARYLLTTTYPDQTRNLDILIGAFRPVNLQLKPFRLPPPLELIYEAQDSGFSKHVGLWKLDELKLG